jgi:hypothetical protein
LSIQKFDYIRSQKLLKACRALPCQNCGISDGSVCAAHSNQAEHGKGRSIKASDQYVASLCHACHHDVDQGRCLARSERVKLWMDAHTKTVAALVAAGLWPSGVPVP